MIIASLNYKPDGDTLKEFLKNKSFFRGIRGPVGSGKSVACCIEIIKPAINKIFENGDLVFGPYSSDGYFASQAYKNFDLTMAVYHDQGLIPFKLISFGGGVNYTSNLSIIRTSPDHGVAYNISGRNIANEGSFREAVFLACKIYTNRNN